MLYSLLRPLLFSFDPETTHRITLNAIKYAYQLKLLHDQSIDCKHHKIMGLDFPNPIGLAAGLDKNGEYINALADRFAHAQILVTGYQVLGQDLSFPENVSQMSYIRDIKDLLEELTPTYQEK